ncbi:MAG: glucose 1-dehydrogenase [Pelagibacterales bacterium]|nr:glucose 1-dehydrogenase [Pelagibacterales bacterium]
MKLLQNKTILITGGSSGIGKASAKIMAREGAKVIICDIQDDEGIKTVDNIKSSGGYAKYYHMNVVDFDEVNDTISKIYKDNGSLDGAFNNAGIEGPTKKTLDYSSAEWNKVINVNITGVFNCMKSEIEKMITQDAGGSIVNTASVAGLVGLAGTSGYNASKHAVIGLSKTAAVEYATKNIRINAVCPGFINTPMLDRLIGIKDNKIKDKFIQLVPNRRMAEPEEIGETVAWLLSDKSSYITGSALPIDGGWTAQ